MHRQAGHRNRRRREFPFQHRTDAYRQDRSETGKEISTDGKVARKIWPEYFNAIIEGTKLFEFRVNDRGFVQGDKVILNEYDPFIASDSKDLKQINIKGKEHFMVVSNNEALRVFTYNP